MTTTPISINLDQIENKFDVRVALDQDRVLQFVGMYESGVDLPPVEVVKLDEDEYAFIDGRHRAAARAYMNLKNVMAVVRNGSLKDNPGALYGMALKANWGGARPPSRQDITHVIVRMIDTKISLIQIREYLNFLPSGSFKAYHADATSIISKRRIGQALDAISEGVTLDNAAKDNGLKPEVLRDILSGKKGKYGKSRSQESVRINEFKSYVSKVLFSANAGISKKLQDAIAGVDSGEMSAKGAAVMIGAWREHLRKTQLRIDDWTKRLESISPSKPVADAVEEKSETPGPLNEKRIRRARPKHRPDIKAIDFKATRLANGFWNEILPQAIKTSGKKTAGELLEYFAVNGKSFTYMQVACALNRLRSHGYRG